MSRCLDVLMSLYGSPLFNYASNISERLYVAWRKALRHLLQLSPRTHCDLVPEIVMDVPVNVQLHKRVLKFAFMCTKNPISKLMLKLSLNGSRSVMCDNLTYISHTYSIDKWALVNYVPKINIKKTFSPRSGMIRDFVDLRSTSAATDRENIDCILIDLCEN